MTDARSISRCSISTCGRCGAPLLAGDCDGVHVRADATPITAEGERLLRLSGRMMFELAYGGLRWRHENRPGRNALPEHRCPGVADRYRAPLPPPSPPTPLYDGEFPF